MTQFRKWFEYPKNSFSHILIVLPLIFSQLCQRIFHILDNRFIAQLGSDVLYIHNIQYTVIVFGQLIGIAGAVAGLVFWKRKETQNKKGGLTLQLIMITIIICLLLSSVFTFLLPNILTSLKVNPSYHKLAGSYIKIGLLNMSLYAIYMCLDGLIIAGGRQLWSFILALLLGSLNFIADYSAVNFLFEKGSTINPNSINPAFIAIGLSSSVILLLVILIAFFVLKDQLHGWSGVTNRDLVHVFGGELGVAIIKSVSPMIYPLQFVSIRGSIDFINTYNMALHLAFLCCLPLTAGVQIAVREASEAESFGDNKKLFVPVWWNSFLYIGFFPTYFMLLATAIFPLQIMGLIYGYYPPLDHQPFLALFFIACMVGQAGHVFAVKVRAKKKNYFITRNFIFSQFLFHLGLFQLLIFFNIATPVTAGFTVIISSTAYTFLNFLSNRSLAGGT